MRATELKRVQMFVDVGRYMLSVVVAAPLHVIEGRVGWSQHDMRRPIPISCVCDGC